METADIQAEIDAKIDEISKLISGTIKNGINEVEASIQRETNEKLKELQQGLPNEMPDVMKTTEKVIDFTQLVHLENRLMAREEQLQICWDWHQTEWSTLTTVLVEIAMGILYSIVVGGL